MEFNSIYTGFSEVYIAKELLSQFYEKGELLTSQIANHSFFANQFLVMKDAFGGSGSAIGIVDQTTTKVKSFYLNMIISGESNLEMFSKLWL